MAGLRPDEMQATFLDHLHAQGLPMTLFLVNEVKLQGYVTHHDRFGVSLERDGKTQYVFKHAISAIDPIVPVELPGAET